MSLNKLLLPLLPLIMESLTGHKNQNGVMSQVQLLQIVTTEVKKQISKLILKIAFGLVATGVLIYSLIVLGQYVHSYLLTYTDGVAFSAIFFAIVSIGCIISLIQMFRPEKPETPILDLKESVHNFSFEKIVDNFFDGLAKGVQEAQQRHDRMHSESVTTVKPTAEPEFKFSEPPPQSNPPHSDSNYRYSPMAN